MDAPAFITRTTASLARPAPLHSTRHVFISSDRDPRCNVRGLFIFITLQSGAVKNNEIRTLQVGQCMQPAVSMRKTYLSLEDLATGLVMTYSCVDCDNLPREDAMS